MPSSIEAYEQWLKERYEISEREALRTGNTYDAVRSGTFLICLAKLKDLTARTSAETANRGKG